jgi:uncharacterized membrane protein YjgN (DUF898 family)
MTDPSGTPEPQPPSFSTLSTAADAPDTGPVTPPQLDARAVFGGDGAEYFKIWIVNVALSVATLGIYSAWAKVRRMQYFYRNTRLADASFDYHGDPIAIFKGRLIAAALFGLYSLAGIVNPIVALLVFVMIATVVPWLICRSLKFRMHNSSYRGIRFRFDGTTQSAYWVFLALPILMVMSLGTLMPFWQQRVKEYQYGNASFGRVPFSVNAPVSEFYLTYLAAMGMAIGVFVLIAISVAAGVGAVALVTGGEPIGGDLPPQMWIVLVPLFVVIGVVYLVGITSVQAFVASRIRNLVWNGLTLGSYRFTSNMRVWPFLRLTLGNLIATVFTLGLFWPFAQVRLVRYLVSTVQLEGPASFDEFRATSNAEERAVGEEVSEFFDFDIGF